MITTGQLSPHNPATGFWPPSATLNSGLYWTIFARDRDTAVPAVGNGNLQTLIGVLVARPRWCPTLSNPVSGQNWMAAYLGYTLQMKTLFRGWQIMVHDTHTRRRTSWPLPTPLWSNDLRPFLLHWPMLEHALGTGGTIHLSVTSQNHVINKNLAIANRSCVSCAHNTLRASICTNISPWPWNLG